jgi:AcrR family transcriptional regulator
VRAATEAEILATARELLVSGGASSLTLREVGRRMGMTASALYRYVDGHGALVDRLTASLFDELVDEMQLALSGDPLAHAAGERFGRVFVGLFARAFEGPLPPDDGMLFSPLPPAPAEVFARSWIRLLGLVMVEVSGEYEHTYLTLEPGQVFEVEMADCAEAVVAALRAVREGAGGH